MKTSKRCNICNKIISNESENWLQYLANESIVNLKTHFHMKEHKVKYLSRKGLIKFTSILIGCFILAGLTFPIWLITLPFWWIHEHIN